MTSNQFQPTGATLQIWETVRTGFLASIRQPRSVLWSIAGYWTAILIVLQAIAGLTDPGIGSTPVPTIEDPVNTLEPPGGGGALALIFMIVSLLAFIDISVTWLRHLVLEEPPSRFLDGRLNRRRWSYFARSLVLSLILLGIIFTLTATMLLFSGSSASVSDPAFGQLAGPVMIAAVLISLYVAFGRLGLYLTAGALGDTRVTLAVSWTLTKGNGLRLTAVMMIVALASIFALAIAFELVWTVFSAISMSLAVIGISIVVVIGNVWAYLVYQAVLAEAYVRLVPEPAPGTLIE